MSHPILLSCGPIRVVLFTVITLITSSGIASAQPTSASDSAGLDWPYWRGPHYNNTSPETGLVDDFNPKGGDGSNVLWKRDDLGTRSTPIVMNGKLYCLARADEGTDREGERVVCVDANTGETIWENRFNVWLSDVPDTRVAWSSVVGDPETGNVYALGVCGFLQCIDGDSGKTIWSIPMHEYFGMISTFGGRTNFPVIADDLVIVGGIMTNWGGEAKPAHRLVGFDKRTGEIVWFNGTRPLPYDTNYSSPALANIAGQKSMVFGSGDGQLWSLQPRTGQPIWHYEISRRGLNSSPLVVGNTVYSGHSQENEVEAGTAMGTVLAIDATGSGKLTKSCEKWRVFEVLMGKSSPVRVGDRLYVVDDGAKLRIYDANTGKDLTPDLAGRPISLLASAMFGCPLVADGKLYIVTTSSWSIWKLDEEKGVEKLVMKRFSRGEEGLASPICSHGNVYITTTGCMYCLRDPNKTPGIGDIPARPAEDPVSEDPQPALVQVVPAEVLMQPGQQQTFRCRLFNSRGQFLKEAAADYKVEGSGSIDAEGLFRANDDAAHEAATVIATVGDLQGQARIRIIPPLPWTFDFDSLSDPPVTWVGARIRHVIRDIDGSKAMVKITTIPKGTRSRCWFGQSDLHDYTMQADVRGSISDDKMPDIGIIAQGYTLDLKGAAQELQLRSWVSQLRMAQTIDFPWKPNTWYVMKLRAENRDGKAVLRGKVWPRDQKEPAEWNIEAVDPSPNSAGSPGLYGNAKDAELALDNIKVYSNEDGQP